jgi:TonB-dependent SusC/RagA subfamily outer membrane receptor
MPTSLSRAALLPIVAILALGSSLAALGGCHRRSSPLADLSTSAPPTAQPSQPPRNHELRRRFPGVDIVRTQIGGFYVRILSGLAGGGEPLYVIDGNPMTVDTRRGIDWFQPEDILQLKVLKDPAETAVYGARGTNGVIVITTKQAPARRDG